MKELSKTVARILFAFICSTVFAVDLSWAQCTYGSIVNVVQTSPGEITPGFPPELILDSTAVIAGGYTIEYCGAGTQYTVHWSSSNSTTSLFNTYDQYLIANDWFIMNESTDNAPASYGIAAINVNAAFSISIVGPQPPYTSEVQVSASYIGRLASGQNPVPFVNQPLVPTSAQSGGPGFTLIVNGTGFISGAIVNWNGQPLTTTFVSGAQLTAIVPAAAIAVPGTASIIVSNPGTTVASNIVFFSITTATNSVSFGNAPSWPSTGTAPHAIAVGDFNDDGKLDMAVANRADNDVSILLGLGNGTFTPAPGSPISVGASPVALAVGDFNGDRKLDLAVANKQSDNVTVLLGTGNSTFNAAASPPATGTAPNSLAAGDFNRDGILDLAVANDGSNNVATIVGKGDGTFESTVLYPISNSVPTAITVADFNSNSNLDLAVADAASNNLGLLLGQGNGGFVSVTSSPATGENPASIAVGDFNGDEKPDLVVANTLSDNLTILLNTGNGTFTPAAPLSLGNGAHPSSVVVGDFNADGRLDLAVTNADNYTVAIFVGGGDGTFARETPDLATGSAPVSVAVGDFNGDGRLDIAVANSGSNNISVFLGTLPTSPFLPLSTIGLPGPNDPQGTLAEPVSTGNGNYFYQHTDFVIPGRGLPLVLQRSYNSLDNYMGPLGGNWTHNYNIILSDSGTSAAIKWGDGHGETFTLSGGVYVSQPGVFNTLVKNSDGTFVLTQKNQTRYLFSAGGKLMSITDKNGNTVALSYDGNGNLVQIADPSGRSLTLTYDASNRIILATDPIGRTMVFSYSGANDLAQVTDSAGGMTKFIYDANHRVSTITLPNNNTLLENTYDATGRVTSQTNGRGFTTTFAYDTPSSGQTTITDPRGKKTIHIYDSSLRITEIKDALGGIISYTYDSNNDRTAVSNQDGWATSFDYDAKGNITSLTDALGNTAIFTYDSKNDLLTAKNPKGKTTAFSYDANGNLHTITDALDHTTTFAYNGSGELTSKTDANSHTTAYAYDSAGNLVQIMDALGAVTNLGYDGIGRLVSIADPNGHTAHAYYDILSRLIRIADALGDQTRFEYDAVGNLAKIIDANGHATEYSYDATNNLITVTDALGHVTQYAYDANNNRISFKNAKGNATSYAYDAINRLTAITDPLDDVTSYAYDPVGNVTGVTDANGKTNHFAYDQLNRLIGISYADGKSVNYTYDPDSNRNKMVDSHGETLYSYDSLDRLTAVKNPNGGTVGYAYDPVGNRSSLTYPDGNAVTYQYDAVNRLSRVTDWLGQATKYYYDPASNLLSEDYPNGASVSFTYDAANRLLKVINAFQGSDGNPISSFTYVLDAVGNRLQVTDGSGKVTAYGYDALNQLTSVAVGTSTTAFTYDAVGNRLTLNAPGTSTQYSYDAADRLLAAGNTTFEYDKNGNQVTKIPPNDKKINFAYDAANRLVAVTGWKSDSSFSYDGDGNRISQTDKSGTYKYLNDVATALPVVLQESGPDGNISYDYGLGLISEMSSKFEYFYQYDGLGSVVGLTDPRSKLAGRYAYDAWGETDLSIPDSKIGTENKFRFTGEALDPGTGLYYFRARYYDSSLARFNRLDPLTGSANLPLSRNRYTYALANPLRYTDHSGLSSSSTSSQQPANVTPQTASLTDIFLPNLENIHDYFNELWPAAAAIPYKATGIVVELGELALGKKQELLNTDPQRYLDIVQGMILAESGDPAHDTIVKAGFALTPYGVPMEDELRHLLDTYGSTLDAVDSPTFKTEWACWYGAFIGQGSAGCK